MAERSGAVAAAQTPAASARAPQGQPVWAAAEGQSAHDSTTLAVAVEGVRGQQQAGGQGMTGGTVAPLGPDRQTAPDSGRTSRAWGPAR